VVPRLAEVAACWKAAAKSYRTRDPSQTINFWH
jgi:hypothetical protein